MIIRHIPCVHYNYIVEHNLMDAFGCQCYFNNRKKSDYILFLFFKKFNCLITKLNLLEVKLAFIFLLEIEFNHLLLDSKHNSTYQRKKVVP